MSRRRKTNNDDGGLALFDPPITPAPAPIDDQQITASQLGAKIRQNLCGVYLTVKRPSGRPMVREIKMEATTKDQDQSQVNENDVTKPCWKIDIHPLWATIDTNAKLIEKCVDRFSVSASVKGEHLVSLSTAGRMIVELNQLRNARMALAREMQEKWATEIMPGLEQKFPQFFENQIKDRLPDPASLCERFDVLWLIRPLTPLDNSHLRLDALSESEAREVIARNNEFIDRIVQQQYSSIFNEVFNEVGTLCDEINSGEYAFGKRKAGAVTEILDMLERVKNFGDFTNEDVIRSTDIAIQTLKRYNVVQINGSTTVQNAIKNAMKPLGAALKELTTQQVGNGRARRQVEL